MVPVLPRLYGELAGWWPLLSPPADYAEEAALYAGLLRAGRDASGLTALELGSGGGHCASQMRAFRWTLSDLSPEMLAQSRRLHPGCEHVPGDMRTLRLDRTFDAVFVHDAVSYMTTEADLEAVCRTAFVHTRPGGTALFVPDHVSETFAPGTDHGGIDGEGRGLRYFEWSHAPDAGGPGVEVDMVLLLREGGSTRVVHDRHVHGLFPRARWLALLEGVGFRVAGRTAAPGDRPLFVAHRPA